MIRILLADDHALVREGLKKLFSAMPDISVTAEAINGTQVLEALRHERFDLLLLDMTMPGISGPDLIARVRAHEGHPPILVLSMHEEPQIARRALAAGAAGYLTKDNDPAVLLAAIRKVANGGHFIDPQLAQMMVFDMNHPPPRGGNDRLSDRELQIMCLLAKGKSGIEIASELSISNKTVSTHKTRLMEKMRFASNADLVKYAVDQGLAS